MIEWFDGYAACYNADPFKIEKLVNKRNDQDDEISRGWYEIRNDVSDIITLPDDSERIIAAQRKNRIYRPLSAVLVFGSGLSLLLVSGLHLTPSRLVILGLLVGLIAIYSITLWFWYRASKRLYRLVRDYYNQNMNKISKQRMHIRSVNQRLIDLLTARVRLDKLQPERYKMRLLHNDYSNIRILREEKSKSVDRTIYVSVVKAKGSD